MKCFNHENKDAVATCQHCGKALCKECAGKHSPCMCDECHERLLQNQQAQFRAAEDDRRQKYVNALVDTRSEFIRTCRFGVLFAVTAAILVMTGGAAGIGEMLSCSVMFFFVPFGWKLLTYLQSFFPVFIIGTPMFWLGWFVAKIGISILAGIPAFAYQLFKTIRNQRKIGQLDHN